MTPDMVVGLVIAGILLCWPVLVLFGLLLLEFWESWLHHKRKMQRMEDRYWQQCLEEEEKD